MDWIYRQLLVQGLWEYFGLRREGRETEPLDEGHMRLVDEVLILAEALPAAEPGVPRIELEKQVRQAVMASAVKLLRDTSVPDLASIVETATAQAQEEEQRLLKKRPRNDSEP